MVSVSTVAEISKLARLIVACISIPFLEAHQRLRAVEYFFLLLIHTLNIRSGPANGSQTKL